MFTEKDSLALANVYLPDHTPTLDDVPDAFRDCMGTALKDPCIDRITTERKEGRDMTYLGGGGQKRKLWWPGSGMGLVAVAHTSLTAVHGLCSFIGSAQICALIYIVQIWEVPSQMGIAWLLQWEDIPINVMLHLSLGTPTVTQVTNGAFFQLV